MQVSRRVYAALLARNDELGGDFGGATGGGGGDGVTVYIQLPNPVMPNPPPLINNGGNAVHPQAVTIGGAAATWEGVDLPSGNPASRVDAAGNPSRFWCEGDVRSGWTGERELPDGGAVPADADDGGLERVYTAGERVRGAVRC